MFKRHYFDLLDRRLKEPRKFIQVISGPRQVGKTTLVQQWIKEHLEKSHYGAADAATGMSGSWIEQQWEKCRLDMKTLGKKEMILFLDEVQKIPDWSEKVKREWDLDTRENINIRVVLLGSSRLMLMKGLVESLAGRFESIYMDHWSYNEMREAFQLDPQQYVWYGGYPGSVNLMEDEERWKSYIRDSLAETAISRDILMLTRVDKPALLKQLFELGCLYSSQIVSYTKMLGQLSDAGNTTTLAHYLELTHQAGLLGGLQKFSRKEIRQRASPPKFQVHNNALLSSRLQERFRDIGNHPGLWGRMVESAVGTHLIHAANRGAFNLYYWREKNAEVDFVAVRNSRILALEVKSGTRLKNTGLDTFRKIYPECRILAIGHQGLPWEEFLRIEPEMLFF
ncbi:MAG: ATP-binding protein [Bacteroidales bacterium]